MDRHTIFYITAPDLATACAQAALKACRLLECNESQLDFGSIDVDDMPRYTSTQAEGYKRYGFSISCDED